MRQLSLIAGLVFFTSMIASCSHGGDGPEPAYEGCATDENWRTFDDFLSTGRVQSDTSSNPKWLSPMDGATVPSNSPPTFSWQPSATNAGTANGNASCAAFTPASVNSLRPLHEPPVSGTVFDVHFSVAGADTYRVLTTRQSATLPASVWQGIAGKQVDVMLYEAQLLRNDVVTGPFVASPLKVLVTP